MSFGCIKIESLERRQLLAAATASVDGLNQLQTIEAIGAAAISYAQPAEYKTASYYDTLAGDLGASIVRVGVWPAFENTNDNNDPNVINWAKFDDSAIASTMEFLKQMQARGVSRVLATVWTPPGWMKTNNAVQNGGQVRADMRAELAEFVSAYIQRARDKWGVNITDLSISNEPWFVEPYQASIHSPKALVEEIKAVSARLQQDGLTTKIVAPEEVISLQRAENYIDTIQSDPAASAAVSAWGMHYLSTPDMQSLKNHIAGSKPIWYTEVGNGNTDILGGMSLARGIDNMFTKGGASTYINWYFSNIPGITEFESLMAGPTPNKKFYALKHFSRFVRPGAKLLTTTSSGDDLLRTTAFKNPTDGALSIILSNNYDEASTFTVNLSGTTIPASFRQFRTSATENCAEVETVTGASTMTITLPARSIVTLYAGPDFPAMPVISPPGNLPISQPNESWKTDAARTAALTGDITTLQNLISAGANIDLAGTDGWTPLDYAAATAYSSSSLISALLNAGASKTKVTVEGMTPLHIAAMQPMVSWPTPDSMPTDRVKQLLNAGFNVNAVDNYGRTPLFYAAMQPKYLGDMSTTHFDTSLMQALLDAGANPNVVDNFGKRALEYAQEEKFTPGVSLLQSVMSTSTATVSGKTFNDLNSNNNFDGNESAIAGRTVYVDLNDNSTLDIGEPSQLTNSLGGFVFGGLNPGLYVLRQVVPSGWNGTTNSQILSLSAGDFISGVNFGSSQNVVPTTGAFSGKAFNDANGNGTLDSGETALVGRTIYIDLNNNSSLDVGESSKVTDGSGNYSFTGVNAGTYTVRQVIPSGWNATSSDQVLLLAAGDNQTGINFGSKQVAVTLGSISGVVFGDNNKNGIYDAGDSVAARVVFLDANGNNLQDSGETAVTSGADGKYTFANLPAGVYHVRRVFPAGYTLSTAPIDITLAAGQVVTGADIGSKSGSSVSVGSIAVSAYNDVNRNNAKDASETALAGVTVYIDTNNNSVKDSGEASAVTDASGNATFSNIAVGSYRVRALLSGYDVLQQPASTISVLANTTSSAVFGLAVKQVVTGGTITGYVVNDANKNGTWNTGEGGIAGRTVWIDLDNDGVLDSNETRVTTASNGKYTFTGVAAGTYKIRTVIPTGWKQNKPVGAYSVTVASGQTKSGNDFMTSLK